MTLQRLVLIGSRTLFRRRCTIVSNLGHAAFLGSFTIKVCLAEHSCSYRAERIRWTRSGLGFLSCENSAEFWMFE
ncbi:hypothetical protein M514_05102 [Trichuris suis]|uniref:Uncharacterized protein n=1 Tax=Trichuris suis TaxID=68888 RepID=A0A085MA37_9BILA|nr:hypothetical protein M513_05102 [Trichuris suis]KFD67238.1 hypothetical protein M514_05102 [Trichuris suis]